MKKILLSFVVPFYNVEKYIAECIHSLYKQDIPTDQYEVILVNDCSQDTSREIVLELMKQYPDLILVDHNINKQQGGARNTGTKLAQGEYIWYIDSDDYIKPGVLRGLIDIAIENELDILHFDYTSILEDGSAQDYPVNYTTSLVDGNTFFFGDNEIWWKKNVEVWRRLHKKSFLKNNNICFLENTYYEDVVFSIEVFNFAKKVLHIPTSPYFYRFNRQSYFNLPQTGQKLVNSIVSSLRCLNSCDKEILDKRYIKLIEEFVRFHFEEVKQIYVTLNHEEQDIFHKNLESIPYNIVRGIITWHEYLFFSNIKTRKLIITLGKILCPFAK